MADLNAKLTPVQGLSASVSPAQGLSASMSNNINIKLQTKHIVAGDEPQVIVADAGFVGLSQVVLDAIPSNYGKISWNGAVLTVS
jgi:hypothetical protein